MGQALCHIQQTKANRGALQSTSLRSHSPFLCIFICRKTQWCVSCLHTDLHKCCIILDSDVAKRERNKLNIFPVSLLFCTKLVGKSLS